MSKILVVVDMQNDFLTGSLANESAVKVIPAIKQEIESGKYDHIIFTRDTHQEDYLETQEGKRLPFVHCVEGTWGWEVSEELLNAVPSNIKPIFIDKPTFGYKMWGEAMYGSNIYGNGSEFTFTGTCTDICVVSNVLAVKAAFPEAQVKCLANCCAPKFGDPNLQESALNVMDSCQVDIIR